MNNQQYAYVSPLTVIPVTSGSNWTATVYSYGIFYKLPNDTWLLEYWGCFYQSSAYTGSAILPSSIVFHNEAGTYTQMGASSAGAGSAYYNYGLAYNGNSTILWRYYLVQVVSLIYGKVPLMSKPTGFVPDGV